MTRRKIILLSACAVLLCIYCVQIVMANRPAFKPLTVSGEVDSIEIVRTAETITLTKNGEDWFFVAEKNTDANIDAEKSESETDLYDQVLKAEKTHVDAMLNQIKNIRILDVAAKNVSDAEITKYELDDAHVLKVSASAKGKTLRTVSIGKMSATGSQTYITADGKNIYLAGGIVSSPFSITLDSLKATETTEPSTETDENASLEIAE